MDVLNIMGTLYSTAIFLSIFNTLVVIPVVNADRAVYYRCGGTHTPKSAVR